MKVRLYLLLLLLVIGCGECPPCEYDIGEEHRNVLNCAGAEFTEYIDTHVSYASLREDLYRKGKRKAGFADCDCGIIYVRMLPDHFGRECETIIHEAAHLEEGCNDEAYAVQVADSFMASMHDNDCWDLADSYNK